MEVRRYEDPADWLAAAMPLLAADEPRHNLLFGIADRLIRGRGIDEHRLWLARAGERPVGALLQTPPYRVVLARPASEDALDALVEAALAERPTVPGVHGVRPEVVAFADRWRERTGADVTEGMAQGIYEARAVNDVPAPPDGVPRRATPADLDTLFPMVEAFADEALAADAVRDRERELSTTRDRLTAEPEVAGMWVWEVDDEIVSLTGHAGRTPSGIRIGPVYTPPEHRGRGYATALVHAQTAWLLADAVDVCFLYTDMANPTSNAVYRRIGYMKVGEATEFAFAS
jgi:uncharacterized protein